MVIYRLLSCLSLLCLALVTISYRHSPSPHRTRYSHILYDVSKLRSGIYRPITSPSFGLDDILSSEDIVLAEERFQKLVKVFHTISETEIRDVVNRSPTYVTVESKDIINAINTLRVKVPYVDPVYVFKQRAAGLDLFMSVIQGDFNHDMRVLELQRIVPTVNITDFVRRAPQTLTPRYASALETTIQTFREALNITNRDAIKIVEKFPGVLSVDVKQGIIRLKNTLTRLHSASALDADRKRVEYYTSPAALAAIIKAVPRVLVQDLSKRINLLQKQYPKWTLLDVINVNPRVLTEKLSVLASRYKALESKFASIIDVDFMISNYPVALLRSPDTLYAAIEAILTHLPSCNAVDVIKNSKLIESDIRRQVDKSRKVFLPDVDAAPKSNNRQRLSRDDVDESDGVDTDDLLSMQRFIDNESVDNIEVQRLNSLVSRDDPDSIWDVESSYSSSDLPVINSPKTLNITDANIGDYTFMTLDQNVSLHLPAELSFLIDPILRDGSTEAAVPLHDEETGSVRSSRDSKVAPPQSTDLEMTRIVFGNVDIFVDKFPYFLTKLNAWNEEYGPEIAYTVLNAVPKSLSKKPSTMRSIIKAFYVLVADALSLDADVNGNYSPVQLASDVDMSTSRGHICDKLYQLLRSSPGALRLKPELLQSRLDELSRIIECDLAMVKRCVMTATYLLTEPLDRIVLRKHLLSNIFTGSEAFKSLYATESDLFISSPRLLAQPLGILIRLYFLRKLGLLEECVSQVDGLVMCNTLAFTSTITEMCKREISSEYNNYLMSLHSRLEDAETVESKEVEGSERKLCGILNALVSDAARIDEALRH